MARAPTSARRRWRCTLQRWAGRPAGRAYLRQAAETALRRYAYREAIAHLTPALDVAPDPAGDPGARRHELALHSTLGPAVIVTQGPASPRPSASIRGPKRSVSSSGRRQRSSRCCVDAGFVRPSGANSTPLRP